MSIAAQAVLSDLAENSELRAKMMAVEEDKSIGLFE